MCIISLYNGKQHFWTAGWVFVCIFLWEKVILDNLESSNEWTNFRLLFSWIGDFCKLVYKFHYLYYFKTCIIIEPISLLIHVVVYTCIVIVPSPSSARLSRTFPNLRPSILLDSPTTTSSSRHTDSILHTNMMA